MDHNQAIQEGMTERYLLGDLTSAQRDKFEEHFFDCLICAADVQSGAVFMDNARTVLRVADTAAPAPLSFAKFGLPFQSAAFLALCLALIVGYQNIVTLPRRQQSVSPRVPEIAQEVSLMGSGARSETQATVVNGKRDAEIKVEIPGTADFVGYELRVLSAGDAVKYAVPVSSEQAKELVLLSVPALSLTPGSYQVAIFAHTVSGSSQELSHRAISVK